MNSKFFTAKNIVLLGVLIALVITLQLFASAIPMFGITLNFSLIPIALAGITLGVWGGTIVGFACGLVVFITTAVLGGEPSTAYFFHTNPVILTAMCFGKTTLAGLVCGLLFKLINKKSTPKRRVVAVAVSSFIIPVVNTAIYMIGLLLMKASVAEFLGLTYSTASVVFGVVFGMIWLNFVLEIAITAILTPPIYRVIKIVGGISNNDTVEDFCDLEDEDKGGE